MLQTDIPEAKLLIIFSFGDNDRASKMTYNFADFCIIAGTVMYGIGKRKKKKHH